VLLGAVAMAFRQEPATNVAFALLELAALEGLAGTILGVLLRRSSHSRFKIEILVVVGYVAILFHLLLQLGVNVTGIFTTSAVATAVVGLAVQDLLNNLAGGLSLEFEREIRVGQYIQLHEASGRVKHIRLRHTAIETNDGDRVILPNSFLVRQAVVIASSARRRFIRFTMPYACDPTKLMEAVTNALRMSPISGIAEEPAPNCIMQELATGHVVYAAVVWLTEPDRETRTTSEVLSRVWFGLHRAGLPVSEITTLVEIKPTEPAPPKISEAALHVLGSTPIFRQLDREDLAELGSQMRPLSYGQGEFIMRQNGPGDSMYFVISGEAAILVEGEDKAVRQVAVIKAGEFFGEASLLTGATRNASAMAKTRLDCYQLDKAGLQGLMTRRPDLAEDMAVVMMHRQIELEGVRQELDQDTARLRQSQKQTELLEHIRSFFGID
jgi:small-conductance mechanosensitive channel/CRP-like cAMP-binding protein